MDKSDFLKDGEFQQRTEIYFQKLNKLLELKYKISGIKNSLHGFYSRQHTAGLVIWKINQQNIFNKRTERKKMKKKQKDIPGRKEGKKGKEVSIFERF